MEPQGGSRTVVRLGEAHPCCHLLRLKTVRVLRQEGKGQCHFFPVALKEGTRWRTSQL